MWLGYSNNKKAIDAPVLLVMVIAPLDAFFVRTILDGTTPEITSYVFCQ